MINEFRKQYTTKSLEQDQIEQLADDIFDQLEDDDFGWQNKVQRMLEVKNIAKNDIDKIIDLLTDMFWREAQGNKET
jgi:hypothetical protein